jgi:hypothetical protein
MVTIPGVESGGSVRVTVCPVGQSGCGLWRYQNPRGDLLASRSTSHRWGDMSVFPIVRKYSTFTSYPDASAAGVSWYPSCAAIVRARSTSTSALLSTAT